MYMISCYMFRGVWNFLRSGGITHGVTYLKGNKLNLLKAADVID